MHICSDRGHVDCHFCSRPVVWKGALSFWQSSIGSRGADARNLWAITPFSCLVYAVWTTSVILWHGCLLKEMVQIQCARWT